MILNGTACQAQGHNSGAISGTEARQDCSTHVSGKRILERPNWSSRQVQRGGRPAGAKWVHVRVLLAALRRSASGGQGEQAVRCRLLSLCPSMKPSTFDPQSHTGCSDQSGIFSWDPLYGGKRRSSVGVDSNIRAAVPFEPPRSAWRAIRDMRGQGWRSPPRVCDIPASWLCSRFAPRCHAGCLRSRAHSELIRLPLAGYSSLLGFRRRPLRFVLRCGRAGGLRAAAEC